MKQHKSVLTLLMFWVFISVAGAKSKDLAEVLLNRTDAQGLVSIEELDFVNWKLMQKMKTNRKIQSFRAKGGLELGSDAILRFHRELYRFILESNVQHSWQRKAIVHIGHHKNVGLRWDDEIVTSAQSSSAAELDFNLTWVGPDAPWGVWKSGLNYDLRNFDRSSLSGYDGQSFNWVTSLDHPSDWYGEFDLGIHYYGQNGLNDIGSQSLTFAIGRQYNWNSNNWMISYQWGGLMKSHFYDGSEALDVNGAKRDQLDVYIGLKSDEIINRKFGAITFGFDFGIGVRDSSAESMDYQYWNTSFSVAWKDTRNPWFWNLSVFHHQRTGQSMLRQKRDERRMNIEANIFRSLTKYVDLVLSLKTTDVQAQGTTWDLENDQVSLGGIWSW